MKMRITRPLRRIGRLAAATLLLAAHAHDAVADSEALYRGETITLVVGYGAGGGYDAYARYLAPWIERRTGATVVVENRPGGGGLVALNQVYDEAGDGRTIMLANGLAAALAQLLQTEGVRFDLLDMPILGRLAAEPSVVMLSERSKLASFRDLVDAEEPVKWSGGGKTDGIADSAAVVSEALGIDSRIIIGYKGAKESALAAMRGEVDAVVTSVSTAAKLSAGGELAPVAVLDREPSDLLPGVPTIFDAVAIDENAAWWIDLRADIARVGRVLVTSPGTPADRVERLRDVIGGILTDPAFVAELEAAKRPVSYLDAGAIESLFGRTLASLNDDEVARVKHVVLEKYYR